nr:hypothetical protein [Tanacetum cinerariifolium]
MSSDSHATITYTLMSSYEVIVNGYFGMPMDPLDPYVQLVMEAPPSPDYIPRPEVLPSPDYILGLKYPEYLPPANDVLPAEEQPLPAAVSRTAESPGYIMDSEPKMEPEEEDGDNEKFEEDSIEYPTSRGDDDTDDDGDDLSKDDADDEDEEDSSDKEEEEEEHLAPTVPVPALHSSIPASEDSDETEPFEEGKTVATPPPFGYRVVARISVQPHILMPFRLETPPIGTPSLLPIPLPTSSFPLPLLLPSTSGSESIPEADIPLRKRARFTTPTGGYEVGDSSIAAAARQIRPDLTVADSHRAKDRLIGKLRRERRYFCTLSTTYAREVAYSHDYCTQIMDYCQSREVHTKSVSSISNCIAENQVKFALCTLIGTALTWWNSYMRAVSQEVAYAMPWKTLKQMMNAKYCPRGEVKKLEVELWNLKVKDTDITSYTLRFQEKPSSLQKIKWIKNSLGLLIIKPITKGSLTILQGTNKTNNHSKGTTMLHEPMLQGLEKTNHTEEPNLCALNETSTMMDHVGNQNQAGNGNAVARAYGLGTAGGNPNANVVMGTFLLNNHCASILFDIGADKSFVSTAFISLININPSTLDYSYDVELADGQIIG